MEKQIMRIECADINGRTFCLMVTTDEKITQEWVDIQNRSRAKAGRAAIASWRVMRGA